MPFGKDVYATVPNVNIGVYTFTIAFWIRFTEPRNHNDKFNYLIHGSSKTGQTLALYFRLFKSAGKLVLGLEVEDKMFGVTLYREVVFDFTGREKIVGKWIHVALTCLQYTVRIFVNGLRKSFKYARFWKTPNSRNVPPKKTFTIGYFDDAMKMHGTIMDLYIIGFHLSQDKISDLHRGQQTVKNVILYVS